MTDDALIATIALDEWLAAKARIRELVAALTKIASPGEGGSPGPDLHECIRIAKAALDRGGK
jgi:plasmid stabilization system protein ParE